MKTTDMTVANTIRDQIGSRALMLLGALNLIGDATSLSFKIRGSAKVSHIQVQLDPSDTYTVSFFKVRGLTIRTVAQVDQVYAEDMRKLIETTTGLYTSL